MTTLLVDAGNSRVKLGWRLDTDYRRREHPREPEQVAFGHDQLARALPRWLRASGLRPRRALGTNVASETAAQAITRILERAGCLVEWVGASQRLLGVVNGYREPGRLGADRWMGLVGVWATWHRRAAPADRPPIHLLAHFGTATTVDTLDGAGRFAGGLILPGHDLMRAALAAGTANLPHADGGIQPFPDNTHDAIVSGVAAAQAGAVVRQWLAARQHYGKEPVVAASGGAWPAVGPEVIRLLRGAGSTQPVRVIDNPVLDGLACLAESGIPLTSS